MNPDHLRDRFELAAISREAVGFTYEKDGVRERRQIIPDPEAPVRDAKGGPYVIGHDIVRDGPRSFRLDQIVRL